MSSFNKNEFSAKPRVIENKSKYRNEEEKKIYQNLMHEKRVIRGNTYARVLEKEEEEGYMNI